MLWGWLFKVNLHILDLCTTILGKNIVLQYMYSKCLRRDGLVA